MVRRYWQPRGQKPVRLPDDLTWAQMNTQLNRQRDATLGKTVVIPGSVASVIGMYRASDDFKRLSDSSLTVYERWLGELEKRFGMLPVSAIARKVAVDFIEVYKEKPATQKHAYAVLYNVLAEAQYRGLITGENPASRLKLSSPKRCDAIWSPAECAAWLAAAREHPAALVLVPYFVLMEYSAQRPGDVLALQWPQYNGASIELVQQKTGKRVEVPVHSKLRAVLDDPNGSVGHIMARPDGRPYTQGRMRSLFVKVSEAAGLEHLQARDLRRTACVRLGEAGCTAIEIAAISGHTIQYSTDIL